MWQERGRENLILISNLLQEKWTFAWGARVKGKSLKEMFISTCFKSHCSRRVEENTCSDSSFCTFESVPGFVFHFLFSCTFCFSLFLYFHISSKSPSYTWSKLCDLLTYEMECLVQVKLEKGKHSNSLLPLP